MCDEDMEPWDVKRLTISLGGEEYEIDSKGFLTFEVFSDDTFNIYEGDQATSHKDPKWFAENVDMSAARRIRDFLNYAVAVAEAEE